jgi:hypothetical protein
MIILGEGKKKGKGGEKMKEEKQSGLASNACMVSLVLK